MTGRVKPVVKGDLGMITKRHLIAGGVLGLGGLAGARWWSGPSQAASFDVTHTDAEWRAKLTPDQYAVLRQSDTERPYTSPLLHEARAGRFACAGCDLDQFSSATKFDSHTGWPSFWAPLDGAVATSTDLSFGVMRSAVHCTRCGGHIGHVFSDGPKPTGQRYCMNGVAMVFKPGAA